MKFYKYSEKLIENKNTLTYEKPVLVFPLSRKFNVIDIKNLKTKKYLVRIINFKNNKSKFKMIAVE